LYYFPVHKMLCVALLLMGWKPVLASDAKPLSGAGTTTCAEPQYGGIGQWVTSKRGFAAAVEVRANVVGTGKQRRCTTAWILHVRKPDGKSQTMTVEDREDSPKDNEWYQENSFEIDAWSRDGSMLLASQIEAQGDWDETTPIIYDFESGKYWNPQLYPLFKKFIVADCNVVYRPQGFAQDGRVLISAMSTDDDREPGTKPCFTTSRWYLDFRKNTISRASPSRQKFGR
jgi:hypothetical protein